MKIRTIIGCVLMAGALSIGCGVADTFAKDDSCHSERRLDELDELVRKVIDGDHTMSRYDYSTCCWIDDCMESHDNSTDGYHKADRYIKRNGLKKVYGQLLNLMGQVSDLLNRDTELSELAIASVKGWLNDVSRYPWLDKFESFLHWYSGEGDPNAFSREDKVAIADWWHCYHGSLAYMQGGAKRARIFLYELAIKYKDIKAAIDTLVDVCINEDPACVDSNWDQARSEYANINESVEQRSSFVPYAYYLKPYLDMPWLDR